MKSRKPQAKGREKRRVLIVDDHSVMREGLALLIDNQPDLTVCGEAEDAVKAMQKVAALRPDIAIVDLSLVQSNGLELVKDIKAQHPRVFVLVLSMHEEALYAERVVRAGARGYVMKRAPTAELLGAMRRVLNGEIYLSEGMAAQVVRGAFGRRETKPDRSPIGQLSDRELEVFQMIGEGSGTSDIAERLHLSMKTVSCYRQNIKTKLQLKNATELVQYAIHWAANLQAG